MAVGAISSVAARGVTSGHGALPPQLQRLEDGNEVDMIRCSLGWDAMFVAAMRSGLPCGLMAWAGLWSRGCNDCWQGGGSCILPLRVCVVVMTTNQAATAVLDIQIRPVVSLGQHDCGENQN